MILEIMNQWKPRSTTATYGSTNVRAGTQLHESYSSYNITIQISAYSSAKQRHRSSLDFPQDKLVSFRCYRVLRHSARYHWGRAIPWILRSSTTSALADLP